MKPRTSVHLRPGRIASGHAEFCESIQKRRIAIEITASGEDWLIDSTPCERVELEHFHSEPDVGAFAVYRETEPCQRMRESLSFVFFRSNWNRMFVHLLAFEAIIAQKHHTLLLNNLSRLQSRYTRNLLQSSVNVQSISLNFLS
jgi:hypothetical protein